MKPVTAAESTSLTVLVPSTAGIVPSARQNHARELVEAFLRGRKPETLRAYRRDLRDFAVFLKLPSAEDAARALLTATPGDANASVLRYRTTMLEQKVKATTINRHLAALRALMKLARMLGMVNWEIEVENLRSDPYRDTRGPGSEAVAAMLARIGARGDAKGLRDTAIVRLLHDCGLRRAEVVSLDRAHYSAFRGLSIIGKARHEREWRSVAPKAKAALEAWLAIRGAVPGPLFIALDEKHHGHRLTGNAVYDIVRQLGEEVGAHARPHGLRHTAITSVLDKTNGNVRVAQQFSRHRDVKTLMIYDDARRDEAGKASELIESPDREQALVLSCARGHEYDEKWAGKFCLRDECKDGARGDPARRIQWR